MTVTAEQRRARRNLGAAIVEQLRRAGPFAFGRVFVRHLLSDEPAPLHRDLNRWHLEETRRPPGRKDAYAAPRGHGKSTAGVEVPAIFHAAYCTRRFQVIISDTYDQAVERLQTIITEVENNDDLRAAFPRLRPMLDKRKQPVSWRDDDLVFECGCRIKAVGAGKSIRGLRRGNQRPDLVYLDDLEDEDSVATDLQIAKRLRWLLRVVLGLAGPTKGLSVLWVGTILSRSALLNLATGAALDEGQHRPEWAIAWTSHIYRAELEDTEPEDTVVIDPETGQLVIGADGRPLTYPIRQPMWSAMTRGKLAAIAWTVGPHAYAAEYLSDPVDEGTALIAPPRSAQWINPGAVPLGRLVALPGGRMVAVATMARAAALDPQYAIEVKGKTDPDLAAVAVVAQYGPDTFVLDGWIGRDRHRQAATAVDLAVRWQCYALGVEETGAQAVTADQAAADGRVPIVPMKAIKGKAERAFPLVARAGDRARPETCRVWLLPEAEKFREYIERFPNGRYDDPVDAVVYALELAVQAASMVGGAAGKPQSGGERQTST